MAFEILFLVAAAAAPQTPAAAPATQGTIVVTGELPDDQKKVCKAAEEEIGSIIPKKVCRTKGEWAAMKRQNERRTRSYINDKNSMSSRAGAPKEANQ